MPNVRIVCPITQLLPSVLLDRIKGQRVRHGGVKFFVFDIAAVNDTLKRL
ncbi:hypothetical protein SJA_C1-03370 [Sphingobium indicum UT26S]|uniref:Uncharacterized protein n=1 Tax=Sphingobium indicum (strain DSM 16413 / CCM 7287 / MTCC 6362 / UT26 / NBRC 101211 / UT26S) TaxID=452662 RepID=D4YXT9_SPHIU|nr:hypothetical protein SJA_C1-03370 [Sphingobium indicum UT26S]